MKKYIFVLLSLFLAAFSGCKEVEDPMVTELRSFISIKSKPGVYQNSQVVYAFNEDEMQLCFNSAKQMCRIQNDDATQYLQMTLSAAPVEGQTQVLYVKAAGIQISLAESYSVEVSQIISSKHIVRLIEKNSLLGFVMYYE